MSYETEPDKPWWTLASFMALKRTQDLTIKYCGGLPKKEKPWYELYLKWWKEYENSLNRST